MPANLRTHSNLRLATNEQPVLYLAFELGWDSWKLAFATGPGSAPREREMPARDVPRLLQEIAEAKRRLRLPADCPVVSCYEAGRDSFWLHRLPSGAWRAESDRRFGEHRGQPPAATGEE